jgi:hypothetical protein
MTQAAAVATDEPRPEDPIDMALAWHNGDPRATIETLLADCQHLRLQLALMEGISSRGMARGWAPRFERR